MDRINGVTPPPRSQVPLDSLAAEAAIDLTDVRALPRTLSPIGSQEEVMTPRKETPRQRKRDPQDEPEYPVKNTFIQYGSPQRTVSARTPPGTCPRGMRFFAEHELGAPDMPFHQQDASESYFTQTMGFGDYNFPAPSMEVFHERSVPHPFYIEYALDSQPTFEPLPVAAQGPQAPQQPLQQLPEPATTPTSGGIREIKLHDIIFGSPEAMPAQTTAGSMPSAPSGLGCEASAMGAFPSGESSAALFCGSSMFPGWGLGTEYQQQGTADQNALFYMQAMQMLGAGNFGSGTSAMPQEASASSSQGSKDRKVAALAAVEAITKGLSFTEAVEVAKQAVATSRQNQQLPVAQHLSPVTPVPGWQQPTQPQSQSQQPQSQQQFFLHQLLPQ
jgi:hypothetical protein